MYIMFASTINNKGKKEKNKKVMDIVKNLRKNLRL